MSCRKHNLTLFENNLPYTAMLLKHFFGSASEVRDARNACSIALEPPQQAHPFAVQAWSAFAVLRLQPPA